MSLGLVYRVDGDELPLMIASDRDEREIAGFLHRHGYRCRPRLFQKFTSIFPEPEYNQVLAEILVKNPSGINCGRFAFYLVRGDVQLVAVQRLSEIRFTLQDLANVLAGAFTYQTLFHWERRLHRNTHYHGQIEYWCHHDVEQGSCRLCAIPDGPELPPEAPRPSGRRARLPAGPTPWQVYKRQRKLSPPKGHTGGSL